MANMSRVEHGHNATGNYDDKSGDDSGNKQEQSTQKTDTSLNTLAQWVSLIGYVILVFSLNETATIPTWLKIASILIFLIIAPPFIRLGGMIGHLISPQWVIAGNAWELMKMRLFWWIGPRFIGAGAAAVITILVIFGIMKLFS